MHSRQPAGTSDRGRERAEGTERARCTAPSRRRLKITAAAVEDDEETEQGPFDDTIGET